MPKERKIGNYAIGQTRAPGYKPRKVVPTRNQHDGWFRDVIMSGYIDIPDEKWEAIFPGGTKKFNTIEQS